ncbi:fimbrial biogenesis chaperone [Pseudomonas schmalbachii]|uniref:Fimbria/pilus periplasmic chaperone n=1 Tax=Pseudomonas schmalbachii TaxID=2816993 RepID=A0ABS3TPY9_9PSED|nr:fimbria/pilus periplasmic chaperone [Pseudomonas schmalbachii]MBO3275233.1 fimbria/pilus periplasmic chaperone [Pseudomonas schmalbachii]
MNRFFLKGFWALCAASLLAVNIAEANVVITGTRVIYPAKEREVTVKLTNRDSSPALVQSWVDKGDPKTLPDQADAPFLVTPPIVRIEPGKGQALRLTYTQESLPQNKESVFWLNVLDVPSVPANKDAANYVQFAFRSRIKVFFRPDGLPGDAVEAAQGLRWTIVPSTGGYVLRALNSSAFHVSVNDAAISLNGKSIRSQDSGMVAPGGSKDFALKGVGSPPVGEVKVVYHWVNDYGGVIEETSPLGH